MITAVSLTATTFIVPEADSPPYLQFSDSPFFSIDFTSGYFHLEDFEDDALNTPGVAAAGGTIIGVEDWGSLVDSVDLDDGFLDGFGTTGGLGRSFFGEAFTFEFDAGVLGQLPTHAGIVWTDGGTPAAIEAFGPDGASLGRATGIAHSDGSVSGTTAEDRFYGVVNAGGISRIVLDSGGYQEADHLQYGFTLTPGPNPRELWRQLYFGTSSNSGTAADTADPDQDGLINFLEFACGLDPTASSVAPVEGVLETGAFALAYTRSKAALRDGVTFVVEWSDALGLANWSMEGVTEAVLEDHPTTQKVKASLPQGTTGQRFARLRVIGE